jgi:hypothetical protein
MIMWLDSTHIEHLSVADYGMRGKSNERLK